MGVTEKQERKSDPCLLAYKGAPLYTQTENKLPASQLPLPLPLSIQKQSTNYYVYTYYDYYRTYNDRRQQNFTHQKTYSKYLFLLAYTSGINTNMNEHCSQNKCCDGHDDISHKINRSKSRNRCEFFKFYFADSALCMHATNFIYTISACHNSVPVPINLHAANVQKWKFFSGQSFPVVRCTLAQRHLSVLQLNYANTKKTNSRRSNFRWIFCLNFRYSDAV